VTLSVATCKVANCCRQTGRTEFKFSIYNVLNKVPAKLRRAMGYWLVVQGNFNLFEVAVFHGVGEQHTWQRDQWEVPVIEADVNLMMEL
jgi:hypothetical protein